LPIRNLKKRIIETPGAFVHEIGGTETHVHLSVTVPPTLLISEFIGKLKGGSSHDVNQAMGRGHKVLEWQSGYGVVSFGSRDLGWVNAYIRNQREHHARGAIHDRLERINPEEAVVADAQAGAARRPVNGPP
jgi:putative transposase